MTAGMASDVPMGEIPEVTELDALIAENSKLRSDLAAARQARDTAQAQATHYRIYYSRTGW